MTTTNQKLTQTMSEINEFFESSKVDFRHKPAPNKWSKIEILGHLVDSARYNLMRFTEIQHKPSPYQVERYDQDKLVMINDYQNLSFNHVIDLFNILNGHIVKVIEKLNQEDLDKPVFLPDGKAETLNWLVEDYPDHMAHHLRQMLS